MRCRYCGSENPPTEVRCLKCQMRLSGAESFPQRNWQVVDSAAVRDIEPETEMWEERQPAPGPTVVYSNPARRTQRPAVQPSLFADQDQRSVVGLEEYVQSEPARRSRPAQRTASRRRPTPGQSEFDFVPLTTPQRPFSKELNRRAEYEVAPLSFRSMASLFDTGVVAIFLGLFLVTVRLALGTLPMGSVMLGCYAGAGLLISAVYKVIWAVCGRSTLGPQLAQLALISLDGHRPSTAQRVVRVFSAWLSVAAAGMGVLWAPLDRDRLSWHDHISQTYYTPTQRGGRP